MESDTTSNDNDKRLIELLRFDSSQTWLERLCLCVANDSAFTVKFFSKESTDHSWVRVNNTQSGFEVMDWWESLQARLKEHGAAGFGCATARIDKSGALDVLLLDEAVDPIADFDALGVVESVSERGIAPTEFSTDSSKPSDRTPNEEANADSTEVHVQSELPTYSKDECFQCIWDCLTESLPENWKTAQMMIEIEGSASNVNYTYTAGLFPKKVSFRTDNVFAPVNAAIAIREIMAAEGNEWSSAVIELRRNGNMQIKPAA